MPIYDIQVETSPLPTRAKNVLKRLGALTLGDTAKLTEGKILKAKWAGRKVLSYIKEWLDSYGLSLADSNLTMPTGFPLLNKFFGIQQLLFDYFGYVEDYVKIPLRDDTDAHWLLLENKHGGGHVWYAPEELTLELFLGKNLDRKDVGTFYGDSIYTQRFLPKWVYRGKDFTMICVDTHTDGNKFLAIFANAKEVKPETHGAIYPLLCEAANAWDLWGDNVSSILAEDARKVHPEIRPAFMLDAELELPKGK